MGKWGNKKKRRVVWERDNGICQLCMKPVTRAEATLDHRIPRSKGGTSVRSNLQIAHKICNELRGNKDLDYVKRVCVIEDLLKDDYAG